MSFKRKNTNKSSSKFNKSKSKGKDSFKSKSFSDKESGEPTSKKRTNKKAEDAPNNRGRNSYGKRTRTRKYGVNPTANTNTHQPNKSEKSIAEPPKVPNPTKKELQNEGVRLNKYLSNSGIASRRKADELIKEGLVTVNGKVVLEMGFKVHLKDHVEFKGKPVNPQRKLYVLLNKPKNIITTTSDEKDRRTVLDLVRLATPNGERIYPVGRLDKNTTGLLLLTNDGQLAQKLSHPSHAVQKIYHVWLDKPFTKNDLKRLQNGEIELEDGIVEVDDLAYPDFTDKSQVGVCIHSGRNRIIRRTFSEMGYEVIKLDRTVYGPLTKKDLPRKKWRYLTEKEIVLLKHY